MDGWHSHGACRPRPDLVREWADLEGKSSAMRHDLYRRHALRRNPRSHRSVLAALHLLAEVAAWLHHAWSLIGSR
jgi:hypothetical protein